MKKLFLVAIMAVFTSSAFAQLVSSHRYVASKSHNVWLDLGVGAFTGDYKDGGLGTSLGLRVNKMFTENIGWDIFKIAAQADTKHFKESIAAKALTGIRVESPELFSNGKVYANFDGGYVYAFDAGDGAFTWEVGAGVKFKNRYIVGVAYESYSKNSFSVGLINLRLGVAF